jgi:hypothetical protein
MTRRVTLRIDHVTLPPGATLDAAAFEAALRAEIAARLDAEGALGSVRSLARVATGPVAAEGPAPFAGVLARATVRGIGS